MGETGLRALALLGAVTAAGCGVLDKIETPSLDFSAYFEELGLPIGAALGESCDRDSDCITGRSCDPDEGVCVTSGNAVDGERCWVTADCAEDLYCDGSESSCAPAGDVREGGACGATSECEKGLVCTLSGFGSTCAASTGELDVGQACEQVAECMAGLSCAENPFLRLSEEDRQTIPSHIRIDRKSPSVCVPGEAARPVGLRTTCAELDEDAPPLAYFALPGEDDSGEFYRLPFPNDIRRSARGIDLSGHFRPGDALGFDVAARYYDAVEASGEAFSTNPTVYFRFSRPYDAATVTADAVQLFLLDADAAGYGQSISRQWKVSAGRVTNYICQNWLSVRAPHGAPLLPGATYAAVLTRDIESASGMPIEVSPTLTKLLQDAAPADAAMAKAHAAYAPLRALIADGHLRADDVLNAAVFTTQDPHAAVDALYDAVQALDEPTVADLRDCSAGETSPCADSAPRACQNANGMVELHGHIDLPTFQHGKAPYAAPEDGGGFELESGVPRVARREPVCFALTLPEDATVPEDGYPLVIYAHGTGGSFTSGITDGIAEVAAAAGAALLGFDLPQHGTRRGGSERDPGELFFNFVNPAAARGNVLQGVADLFSALRWAQAQDGSLSGRDVRFDLSRSVLFGHSQGATHGALALPLSPVCGAVLSGLGGDLGLALTHKRSPVDAATLMPQLLLDPEAAAPERCADGDNCVGANHPALSIIQGYFDSVDAVNFAGWLDAPPEGFGLKHVLQPIGENDSYSPDLTMAAYARASGMPLAGPWVFPMEAVYAFDGPVSGNVTDDDVAVTQAIVQYAARDGEDGHFVSFDVGANDVEAFVRDVLQGETPIVDP